MTASKTNINELFLQGTPMPNHLHHWLAAVHMQNINPRKFLQMVNQFADIENLFAATTDAWKAADIPEKYWEILRAPNWKAVESDLKWCEEHNHHIISLDDPIYPLALKELSDPPLLLFVRGDVNALSCIQFAIVGSRNATATGIKN